MVQKISLNHHVGWLHQKKIWSMIISSRNRCQYHTSSHLCRWHHYYKQWQQVFIDQNSFSIPHFTWRISLSLSQHKYTNNLITTLASTIPISWRLLLRLMSSIEKMMWSPRSNDLLEVSWSSCLLNHDPIDIFLLADKVSQLMTSTQFTYGTPDQGLFFPTGSDIHLFTYSDVDWARCRDTCRPKYLAHLMWAPGFALNIEACQPSLAVPIYRLLYYTYSIYNMNI